MTDPKTAGQLDDSELEQIAGGETDGSDSASDTVPPPTALEPDSTTTVIAGPAT